MSRSKNKKEFDHMSWGLVSLTIAMTLLLIACILDDLIEAVFILKASFIFIIIGMWFVVWAFIKQIKDF